MRSFLVLWLLGSGSALAGELVLELAPSARLSTWRGDPGGGAQIRVGYRLGGVFTLDAAVLEELHAVDVRQLTGLSVGVAGTLRLEAVRPFLRAFFVHQHEQGWVSVSKAPLTSVLGVGSGILHRVGFGFTAGAEKGLVQKNRWELFFAPALNATVIPDPTLGPTTYFGLLLGIGLNYATGGGP
jgi:hypothetical protein